MLLTPRGAPRRHRLLRERRCYAIRARRRLRAYDGRLSALADGAMALHEYAAPRYAADAMHCRCALRFARFIIFVCYGMRV